MRIPLLVGPMRPGHLGPCPMALVRLGTFTYVIRGTLGYPRCLWQSPLWRLGVSHRNEIGFQHTPLVTMDGLHGGQSENLITEFVEEAPL
jgi:hypothetical protein